MNYSILEINVFDQKDEAVAFFFVLRTPLLALLGVPAGKGFITQTPCKGSAHLRSGHIMATQVCTHTHTCTNTHARM